MNKYKVTMDPPVLTLTPSGKTNNPTLKKIQTVTFNHFLTLSSGTISEKTNNQIWSKLQKCWLGFKKMTHLP